MFRVAKFSLCVTVLVSPCLSNVPEDDHLPVGSVYEGVLKRFGLPNDEGLLVGSYAAVLTVTERKEDVFEGHVVLSQGKYRVGFKIEGTVSRRGGVKFTATEVKLENRNKQDRVDDILGSIKFFCSVADGTIKAKYRLPNAVTTNRVPRFGTMELKLKTDI